MGHTAPKPPKSQSTDSAFGPHVRHTSGGIAKKQPVRNPAVQKAVDKVRSRGWGPNGNPRSCAGWHFLGTFAAEMLEITGKGVMTGVMLAVRAWRARRA